MRRRSTNNTDTMTASEFRRLISGDLPRNSITTPIGNRKVLNATKTEENGVIFDSRLERYMHDLLKSHGIGFLFQKRYTLLAHNIGGEIALSWRQRQFMGTAGQRFIQSAVAYFDSLEEENNELIQRLS